MTRDFFGVITHIVNDAREAGSAVGPWSRLRLDQAWCVSCFHRFRRFSAAPTHSAGRQTIADHPFALGVMLWRIETRSGLAGLYPRAPACFFFGSGLLGFTSASSPSISSSSSDDHQPRRRSSSSSARRRTAHYPAPGFGFGHQPVLPIFTGSTCRSAGATHQIAAHQRRVNSSACAVQLPIRSIRRSTMIFSEPLHARSACRARIEGDLVIEPSCHAPAGAVCSHRRGVHVRRSQVMPE